MQSIANSFGIRFAVNGCPFPVTTLHHAYRSRIVQQIEQQGRVRRHHELYTVLAVT